MNKKEPCQAKTKLVKFQHVNGDQTFRMQNRCYFPFGKLSTIKLDNSKHSYVLLEKTLEDGKSIFLNFDAFS